MANVIRMGKKIVVTGIEVTITKADGQLQVVTGTALQDNTYSTREQGDIEIALDGSWYLHEDLRQAKAAIEAKATYELHMHKLNSKYAEEKACIEANLREAILCAEEDRNQSIKSVA